MNRILDEIKLNKNLRSALEVYYAHNEEKINRLADKCKQNGFAFMQKKDDMTRLAVSLVYAERHTLPMYNDLGIDEKIFFDTMADIAVWCENNNNKGLKNIGWIKNHLCCELFKVGRLQYQIDKARNVTFDYDCLPFDFGDNIVNIHIPQGEPLSFSACVESVENGKEFLKKYFPDFTYEYMVCESWLMYDNNYLFMESGCNILQFQSMFDIVYSSQDDRQAIERIFGKRRIIKSSYPENTTLQRNAKKYILSGKKLGIGIGVIEV